MYATAHRVRSPTKEGINAFLSLHAAPSPGAAIDWETPSVQDIAEQHPGILTESDWDLRPGGNTVRSYLDVVARDGTKVEDVRAALESFEQQLANAPLPHTSTINRIGIRFGAVLALEHERVEEFQALRNRLLRLLERTQP
jgi:hypothetical protein